MKSIFQTVLLLCLLLVVGSVKAQNVTKGTVTDANGDPVIGATVMEQGNQQNATVTDFDGNFSLNVSGKNPIVVSYIGMKPKTVDVKGKSQVNIKLEEDNTVLNDIVVIGYGTVRKKDLTGSVASLSADKVAEIPVSNVGEAMTGKLLTSPPLRAHPMLTSRFVYVVVVHCRRTTRHCISLTVSPSAVSAILLLLKSRASTC